MNMDNFDPDSLLKIANQNLSFILDNELANDVPLQYFDANGQYMFRYKNGAILPARRELSFIENWDNHKRIMTKNPE